MKSCLLTGIVIGGIILVSGLLSSVVIMAVWNHLLSPVFHIGQITYGQAILAYLVFVIISAGFRSS